MSEFATWEELSPLEQAREIWWDMYKDANGFRPRGIDTSAWTLDDFNKEFEFLESQIEAAAIEREQSQERAAHDFEMRIQSLIMAGAKDREMALRWTHEAEGSDGDDEYLCYLVGLPYGYFKK